MCPFNILEKLSFLCGCHLNHQNLMWIEKISDLVNIFLWSPNKSFYTSSHKGGREMSLPSIIYDPQTYPFMLKAKRVRRGLKL
jgi:hypothetical protein